VSRLIKTSVPGLVVRSLGRDGYDVSMAFSPTDGQGWTLARALPGIVREAIAEHEERTARMRQLRRTYRLKRRHW
jgi:hypothetical protein